MLHKIYFSVLNSEIVFIFIIIKGLLLFLGCQLKFKEPSFEFEKKSSDKIKKIIKTLLYPMTSVIRKTCYNKGKALLPSTFL